MRQSGPLFSSIWFPKLKGLTGSVHPKSEGAEGVDARQGAVGPVAVRLAQLIHPVLRHLAQPPQHVLTRHALRVALVQALVPQELRPRTPASDQYRKWSIKRADKKG